MKVNGMMEAFWRKVIILYVIGIYIYTDGTKYNGDFHKGKKEGKGTCFFPNGDKYVGMWKDGKMNGQGNMQWNLGTYYYANGDKYAGEYRNGLMQGKGK